MKSLPARPSLESLRKQAKRLARERSVSLRDAQLALAREYGYPGWHDLLAEVNKRLGKGLEWAASQAERAIHDNDVDGLKKMLTEYPALLSWPGDDDKGLLGFATDAYGDAFGEEREGWFTRRECAELLIDAGAIVLPKVTAGLLQSRAVGLLRLFQRKGLLPHTLEFMAALGDRDAVRAALDEQRSDAEAITVAFVAACRFEHVAVASLLLDRLIALEPELGRHIDARTDRGTFITSLNKADLSEIVAIGPWKFFVQEQVDRALQMGDVPAFITRLTRDRWVLGDDWVDFQNGLIQTASFMRDRGDFIAALLDLDPAILRRQPPPPSQAIEHAITYGNTHLMPLLTRIWPVPDDLPHAAGVGDLTRVKRWFDSQGKPVLGDVAAHQPATSIHPRERQWGRVGVQQVLDTALAWSVINSHFDVADFLLAHGADVNTNWNSHEPASILHHLVFLPDPYERMKFLIDRGYDLTIEDYRWKSTAWGWAYHALKDEKMAQWLKDAERRG